MPVLFRATIHFRSLQMSYLSERKIVTREKRLSSLSHFNGTLEQLASEISGDEIKQKIRTFTQIHPDEIILAAKLLSTIQETAVIIHGCQGCAAGGIGFSRNEKRNIYSTNLQERDTILGSDAKLSDTVRRVYHELSPRAVFIISTPVVAINNDDISSVIYELEDELNIKLVPIFTDGFKTKNSYTGYDIALHGLLKYLVLPAIDKDADPEKDFVNIISVSESKRALNQIKRIFSDLGLKYNIIPNFSSIQDIIRAKHAKASIVLNPDEGAYLAQELQESFGVEYIPIPAPIGLEATKTFIQKLAGLFGIQDKSNSYIRDNESKILKQTVNRIFSNKAIFLETDSFLLPNYINLLEELGARVTALAVPFIDLNNRKIFLKLAQNKPLTPIIVGNGQLFEKTNELSKNSYDYFLSNRNNVAFAADYNTIPITLQNTAVFGYSGFSELYHIFSSARFFPGSNQNSNSIYADGWLKKRGSWYVKQEVN